MNDNRETIDEGDLTTADIARPESRPAETGVGEPTREPEPEAEAEEPFFPRDGAEQLRSRWTEIQAGFVDEPRRSVEEADGLVAAAIKQIAETFANERSGLEAQWDRGDDVSTEDLRIALRRYRAFFDRILSM
jgi:hypothetical protein